MAHAILDSRSCRPSKWSIVSIVSVLAVLLLYQSTPENLTKATLNFEVQAVPKHETVRIIVQECCRDDLIHYQVQLFNKFLYESAEVILVVSSNDTSLQQSLRGKAASLNFTYSQCPSPSLPDCYDFSYAHWVHNFTGLVVFANDDMFLWRPFSVRQYKQRWDFDIAAVVETHAMSQAGEYLHPGFHILDTATAPKSLSSMKWGPVPGTDVGGKTLEWMQRHPGVRLHPMAWSRNIQANSLSALRLIPIELAALMNHNHQHAKLHADLYLEDFAILHPRGSSNWQHDSAQQKNNTQAKVKQFLTHRLQDAPLTWSHAGVVTKDVNITKLSGHIHPWHQYQIAPFSSAPTHGSQFNPTSFKPPSQNHTWLKLLFSEAERIGGIVDAKKREIGSTKLLLPAADPPRTNLDLRPARYDAQHYSQSTVYYWKYVFNSSTPQREPEFTTNCGKRAGQKYWVATYAAGAQRQRLAHTGLTPSCMLHGADEVVVWTPEDLDIEYKKRNAAVLGDERGVGNWAWKHYVQYMMLERMAPGDILAYMDSDMNCTADLMGFYCLADKNDVTPFHHNHPWYTLSRLSKRDTLVFMNMDREGVAHSVQYSGGNVFYKKTNRAVQYVRELAAWSMQPEVVRGWHTPSNYSIDWPEYTQQGMMHQCDQAVSSALIMKYGFKSYPWVRQGFGAGSDDARNAAERAECGMPLNAQIRLDNLHK